MFDKIEDAIEAIRKGEQIIVVDDDDRENEGDLLMAADKATPEAINFMIKKGGGLICAPLTADRLQELNIPKMVEKSNDRHKTAFTVSVDAADCATGISAAERARTIRALVDPAAQARDFTQPGHVFPLIANSFGVLMRAGHTEAAVDMARLAGCSPAGVICEIIKENGDMARLPELLEFAKKEGLKIISIADLISYRRKRERIIERTANVEMPTKYGDFRMYGYVNRINGEQHVALVKNKPELFDTVLVRVHSECLTGDVFGSMRCDCGDQLHEALKRIEKEGVGVLLYLRQEGRGIGLINKLKAYELQEQGMDTVEANIALGFKEDLRDYAVGAEMLADLGVKKIRLMTNNPQKVAGLKGYGLEIVEIENIEADYNHRNEFYMRTKCFKMGHMLKKI